MRIYCEDCEMVFDDDKIVRGVDSESGPYALCPNCKSDAIFEVGACRECGKEVEVDESYLGICHECLMEKATDYELVKEYSKEEQPEEIKLNTFLAYIFDRQEIEEILWKHLDEAYAHSKHLGGYFLDEMKGKLKDYIADVPSEFAEFLDSKR